MINIELHTNLYMMFIFHHKFGEVLLWHNRTTQQASQDTLQEGNLLYLPFESYLEHLLVHLWFLLVLHSLSFIFCLLISGINHLLLFLIDTTQWCRVWIFHQACKLQLSAQCYWCHRCRCAALSTSQPKGWHVFSLGSHLCTHFASSGRCVNGFIFQSTPSLFCYLVV